MLNMSQNLVLKFQGELKSLLANMYMYDHNAGELKTWVSETASAIVNSWEPEKPQNVEADPEGALLRYYNLDLAGVDELVMCLNKEKSQHVRDTVMTAIYKLPHALINAETMRGAGCGGTTDLPGSSTVDTLVWMTLINKALVGLHVDVLGGPKEQLAAHFHPRQLCLQAIIDRISALLTQLEVQLETRVFRPNRAFADYYRNIVDMRFAAKRDRDRIERELAQENERLQLEKEQQLANEAVRKQAQEKKDWEEYWATVPARLAALEKQAENCVSNLEFLSLRDNLVTVQHDVKVLIAHDKRDTADLEKHSQKLNVFDAIACALEKKVGKLVDLDKECTAAGEELQRQLNGHDNRLNALGAGVRRLERVLKNVLEQNAELKAKAKRRKARRK